MSRSSARRLPAALLAAALGVPVGAITGQQQEHTVVRGNTLWELADRFYSDPWQWTRIWEANRDRLQDPDVLEPGQVIRIPGREGSVREVVVTPAVAETDPAETPRPAAEPPGAAATPATVGAFASAGGRPFGGLRPGEGGSLRPPLPASEAADRQSVRDPLEDLPAVADDVVAGAPFLVLEGSAAPEVARVAGFAGAEEIRAPRSSARLYDRLTLEVSGGSLAPGTRLQAYRFGRDVPGLGRVAVPSGVIEVVAGGGDVPVGEVLAQFDALRLGDLLRPLPEGGLAAGVVPGASGAGPEARVVAVAQEHALQNIGDYLFIDLGRGSTSIGDELVPVWPNTTAERPEGRLQVVAVQEGHATVRILNMVNPVFEPGLVVRIDRRMPGS